MNITAKEIIEEQGRLEQARQPYESLKVLCTQLALPGRSDVWDLFGLDEGKANKGRKLNDATAIKGMEIWSNGIIGHYMPKEINWFSEQMSDRNLRDSKTVRQWLQDTDEHLRFVINQSNYYEQKLSTIKDSGCIGDSFLFIDQDGDTGKQIMLAPHPREFWIRRDYWGRVVCIHHKFDKTIREIADEFGDKGLSEDQRLQLQNNPNLKITVIHAIYKNKDYSPSSPGVKNMFWQHYYVNLQAKIVMRQTGTVTCNPVVWSLNRPSHEQYGRGIVSQMLIEIITANIIGRDMATASQMAVKPPMLITSAIKHKLDMGAGGINFVGNKEMQGLKMGDLIARLIDSSGYPFGQDQQVRWQQMIEDRFGVSLFLAMNYDQTSKTAYEIRAKQAEKAVLMAPFLGTLGTTTDAELDRIYSIELEAGRAPEIPDEVLEAQNGRIDIQYIGPLAQLLRQYYETGSLLTTIANIKEALSVAPDSAIVINGDELMRKILQSGNTPESIILSEEEVLEIRAIAAQREEAQMQMQLASQAAAAVPDLSKKIEKDSVLSKLTQAA